MFKIATKRNPIVVGGARLFLLFELPKTILYNVYKHNYIKYTMIIKDQRFIHIKEKDVNER